MRLARAAPALLLAAGLMGFLADSALGFLVGSRGASEPTTVCGYESCPKSDPKKLNVHLVAHTHDDVGWLKTVDQYYYGSRSNIQLAGVQYIIDSVLEALLRDPTRRFIYVETAFLWKWWEHQDEKQRETLKRLINEGRLEIISGAWSMNDEAVTHYHSIVDQFTWGFRRLNDTFGSCARPKIGWQIDPFGHSREQASLFAQMGFDGTFFARLDYRERSKLLKNKDAEFVWEASPSLGKSADLFTSILYNFYMAPNGFCFDIFCDDEPMIDDIDSPGYNIVEKVESFIKFVESQAKNYRTNNVILTMGGDFMYHSAEINFKNMDKLIKYVNQRNGTNYNVFYSTPSCYMKALNEKNLKWPVRTEDFFPYGSDDHAYWTGYYTSRPALKFFERMGNNFLQVVKQLSVLANEPDNKELQLFREVMGVLQHHDAITGTEKQHVTEDYARLLYASLENGATIASKAINKLASKKENPKTSQFHSCLLLNISSCSYTSDYKNFVVTIYNPTSQGQTTYVRVPVQGSSYSVKDFNSKEIVSQIVPISKQILNVPGRVSKATKELIFAADNINPLGYQSFYVTETVNSSQSPNNSSTNTASTASLYKVNINSEGKLEVRTLKEQSELVFEQSFHYYEAAVGNNKEFRNRSSGAYVFRPKNNLARNISSNLKNEVYDGPLVQEIHSVVNDWISQVTRFYITADYIEFDWLVGPIPINDNVGKEVITRYSSSLKTNGEFYTDSNGREMLKRKRNERTTYTMNFNEEPVTSNYYPVTSKISIEDKASKWRISALTDRAQGASSLREGEIELMVHRRLLNDDKFGVSEALNETAFGTGLVVRGQHYLVLGNPLTSDQLKLREKELAIQLALRPWTFITPVNSLEEWTKSYKMKDDSAIKTLPKNVRILTLEPWKKEEILIRLEHMFEKDESPKYSVPVDVNLKDLFTGLKVQSIRETTLGANQWAEDVNRFNWQSDVNEVSKTDDTSDTEQLKDSTKIRLTPMQIRTFIVKVSLS